MDSKTARQLHHHLAPLGTQAWHRATVVVAADGSLLFQFGVSDAIRTEGGDPAQSARRDDAEESLYLAPLSGDRMLGVLFDQGTEVDAVRDAVRPLLDGVNEALARA